MNPFEQLERIDSVSEPRQAFEDVVSTMLQDCELVDGRVRVFHGDGGIDAFKGSFAEGEQLVVYQSKYFTKPWANKQKEQIRGSFQTVNKGFRLKNWFLCIPSRPTKEDLRWFDNWREKQAVPIDLIDGDDLTKLLDDRRASRTRQRLRDWGILSVPGGSSVVHAEVHCIRLSPTPKGPAFRVIVKMTNLGDVTAEDMRINFRHSASHWVPAWSPKSTGTKEPYGP
jgi:hypothetical protein